MSPKNAMKMINIQKSLLVYIGFIWSILSTLALFSPYWSYFVHIGPI